MRAKHRWKPVQAIRSWRPKPGDDLIGYYRGQKTKKGNFGEYDLVVLDVPYQGTFLVSGSMLMNLVDGALLKEGDLIRILYQGKQDIGDDRKMKLFELMIAEGKVVPKEELPVLDIGAPSPESPQ